MSRNVRNIAVFYATREGQTRRIAEYVATALRQRGLAVDVQDVGRGTPPDLDLARYCGAIVAASIHMGKHEREMVEFVKTYRNALERMPAVFLSVSLSQAAVEGSGATSPRKSRAAAEVEKTIERFLRTTRWRPSHAHPVAGALLYRQYGPGLRLLMRFISKVVGASTDTSRDHEYTDWNALSRFADEMAADVAGR